MDGNKRALFQADEHIAYKPKDLVALLGLGRSTVYELLLRGKIASKKYGRRTIIPREAVLTWLRSLPDA